MHDIWVPTIVIQQCKKTCIVLKFINSSSTWHDLILFDPDCLGRSTIEITFSKEGLGAKENSLASEDLVKGDAEEQVNLFLVKLNIGVEGAYGRLGILEINKYL